MASTYSPNLRIELIGNGEQSNTWGTTTNTNLGTLIEQAISGLVSVDVTAGDVTLTSLNGASDQSRQMIIVATGTPGVTRTITTPAVNKVYIVYNNSNAALSFIASGGTGVSLSAGAKKLVYCDGTNFVEAINSVGITSGSINGTTIGATTASTGAFTTLSASSTVSGTGFSTYLASPPAIGGTTAAAGKFTTLEYTGTLTGSTGILNIGSGQVYKDASGNVGIGTSSLSNGVRTVIQGTQTGGAPQTSGIAQTYGLLRLQGSTFTSVLDFGTNGGNYNWIQATDSANLATTYSLALNPNGGNVGIGTTTSLSRLTALGTTSTVSNGASTRNPIASIRGGNDNNRLDFYVDNSGATAIMGLGAYNTAGAGTAMAFYTGASASESMRIDSSGNVGIGTASPSGKLDLYNSNFGGDNTLLYLSSVNSASAKINYAGLGYEVSQGAAGIEAGAMIFRTYGSGALTERMRIDSSGNLLVGTTSATAAPNNGAQLIGGSIGALSVGHASGTATGNYFASFAYAGAVIGTITQNLTTGVLYNVSSDQRLKTNIQPAGSAIQSILDFPVDQFDWLSDGSHQDFGGIAQKILKVIPEMVSVPENPEEMMGVDWSKAVPRLIKTIQELNARLTKAGI